MVAKEKKAEMELICPKCASPIDPRRVDIQWDEARCSHCGANHKASELYEKKVPTPPPGSIIEVAPDEEGVTLRLPSDPRVPLKTKLRYIYVNIFLLVWAAPFGYMLFTESHPYAIYLFLGLLFIVVSMSYLVWFFMSPWKGEQVLKIGRKEVELIKGGSLGKKVHRIPKDDIYGVSLEMPRVRGGKMGSKTPALITEKGKHFFFNYASIAEKEWVVKHLKTLMK